MSNLYQYNGKEWVEIAKNGKDAIVDYEYIISQIPKAKDGLNAVVDYNKVVNETLELIGDTEETPEEIRNKLELLQGDERLDKSAIRGIKELEDKIEKAGTTIINQSSAGGTKNFADLNDVNVSGVSDGDMVVYDESTGKWIPATPTDTDEKVKLNASDPTAGYLDDKITGYGFLTNETDPVFTDQKEDFKTYSGFVNRTDSTISIDGSGVFTIAPAVTSYGVYTNGTGKHTISTSQTVTVTDDQTITYIYIDSTGTLQKSTTPWDLASGVNAPTAIVFKDGTTYTLTDERHGYERNRAWHKWAHSNIGAVYHSGLTGTFTNTTLSITQGVIYDEDILFDTVNTKSACSLWYRNATTGMRMIRNSTTPYYAPGGVLKYDNGSGTPASVSSNKYTTQWVYASNDATEPIYVVIGQNDDTNLTTARNATAPVINLSTAEWKLIYRVIYRNASGTPTFIEASDFRTVQTGTAISATTTDHSALINRDVANQHPATAITNTPAGNIAATTVQAAIDELDSEKLATTTAASTYAKLDGTNQPFTGNTNVSNAAPETRLTDTTTNEYSRWTKTDVLNASTLYNRVERPGGIGYGVNYNGSQYGTVASGNYFLNDKTSISISCWVYVTAAVDYAGIVEIEPTPAYGTGLRFSTAASLYVNALVGSSAAGGAATSSNTVTVGGWNHVAMTWTSGEKISIFLNGTKTQSAATFTGAILQNDNLLLGYDDYAAARKLNGAIDDVIIWSRKLTDAEVGDLYNGGTGVFLTTSSTFSSTGTSVGTSCELLTHMDENTGLTAADTSGNSRTTTIGGTWTTGKVPTVSTVIEVPIIKSINGVNSGEEGIVTLGYSGSAGGLGSRTVIDGITTRFNVLGVEKEQINSLGHNVIDSFKYLFGTGSDASIYYDGTDLKINPKEVGTGVVDILGYAKIGGAAYITNNSNNVLALQTGNGGMQANFMLLTTPYNATGHGLFINALYDGTTPGWEYTCGTGNHYAGVLSLAGGSGLLTYQNTAAAGANGAAATMATRFSIDKDGNVVCAVSLKSAVYKSSDGTSGLAGTKVYYVADSSGGTVNRKLTFKDGLLVSET